MVTLVTRCAWTTVRASARRILVATAGIVLAGCGGQEATAPRPLFSSNGPNGKNAPVHITPAQDTLDALQASLQLVANVDVTWSSLTPTIVAVDADGGVLSVGPGTGLVQARGIGGRKADTATVVVRQVPAALHVSPDSLHLSYFPGITSSDALTAVAEDANGYSIADAIVTWVSDLLSVATVSADGIVTAVDTGSTTIRAILGTLSDTTVVQVVASPYP
jgi:Big-like domain-containing protein